MATPSRPEWLGRTAYDAYGASSGRSGRKDWETLHPAVQANWTAAGEAVYAQLLDDFDLIGDPALAPDADLIGQPALSAASREEDRGHMTSTTPAELARFAFEAYRTQPNGQWSGRRWDQLTEPERVQWARVGEVMRHVVLGETAGRYTLPVSGLYNAGTWPPQLIARVGENCPTCGTPVRALPDWDAPPEPEPDRAGHRQVVEFDTVEFDHG